MSDENSKEYSLKVTRDVVLDLWPLYSEGEARPGTRILVEEYLKQDAQLRGQLDLHDVQSLGDMRPLQKSTMPADLEMRSLRRTQGLFRWQRRIYAWALALTITSLSGVLYLQQGSFAFHFFFRDYPQVFVPCISLAVSLWVNYFVLKYKLRPTKL